MTSPTELPSRFASVVSTVRRFPIAMVVFGWFLVAINTFFGVMFLINAAGVIPGLAAGGADQQAAIMLAGRNLGQALLLAFALLYKDVRVMQFVWLMAIIREVFDLAAALIRGTGPSPLIIIVVLGIEVAAVIYLGAIATGRVAKYRPAAS